MPRHALLIDDEPLARIELRRLLQRHPDIAVAGEAGTLNEARERLAHHDYDLVFLDIQLRGGTGFELLPHIPPVVHIVFVTAYDRYAVRAFEVNALDYLLKPVTPDRLAASIKRMDTAAGVDGETAGDAAAVALGIDDRVFVKSGNATRFVPVNDIVAISSNENYTELRLRDNTTLMALRTLKSWQDALPAQVFVRIHRGAVINLHHVRAIVRGDGDDLRFEFDPPLPAVSASRRRLADLRQRLAEAGLEHLLP